MTIPIIPNGGGQALGALGGAVAEIINAKRQHEQQVRAQAGESMGKVDELVKLGILPHDVYQRPDIQQMLSAALSVPRGPAVSGNVPTLPSPSDEVARLGTSQVTTAAANPESEQAHTITGVPSARVAEAKTGIAETLRNEQQARANYYNGQEEDRGAMQKARARLLSAQADIAEKDVLKASKDVETQGVITDNIRKQLEDPKSELSRASSFAALGALPYLTGRQSVTIASMNRDEQRIFQLTNGAIQSGETEYREEINRWQQARDNFVQLHPNWQKNKSEKSQLDLIDSRKPDRNQIIAETLHTSYRAGNIDPTEAQGKLHKALGGLEQAFPREKEDTMRKVADYIAGLPADQQEAELRRAETKSLIGSPFDATILRSMVHEKLNTAQDAAK